MLRTKLKISPEIKPVLNAELNVLFTIVWAICLVNYLIDPILRVIVDSIIPKGNAASIPDLSLLWPQLEKGKQFI